MRLLCGGGSSHRRRKRNIMIPESYYSATKQSPDMDELSMNMENSIDNTNQQQQQQHAEQILDLIRRTSAVASTNPSLETPIIRRRRNHYNHHNHNHHYNQQPYSIIVMESQNIMENCCNDFEKYDCRENVLREQFQKICAPNLVTTMEVFRS
ncbi:hypothetical protein BLA29_005233 [Euroglyphus maynei]|uniref:Uncharacterized protein n=1 Tax=Euroglyphus maynei TaxID=6958 RepID=A0A1Y3BH74_EURMA|nr:hypothetical protein BLA29_005233 [Euroglyphus maynei]